MARVDEVKPEVLDARQRRLYDDIMRTRPRGKLSGPFSVWMHRPDIAEPANALADCFRVHPRLDKRLIELITLLMCRAATVEYAWAVHAPLALQAGLSPQVVDAIRGNKRPDFSREDERLIYDLVTELLTTKRLSDATFSRAESAFGRDGVIEAVSCAGFYSMAGFVLNAFAVPPPAGGEVLT
ncbi:MAG TPA: carboxymuconolactone decarboxylase family protein [Xanthobacteraceae bacterium]|jgi:4-carboxymuconolactone decarboxylase|nr:carboxymuconolactone decarboxylase family protein [Xanthobacteraceae bacterium]